MTVKEETSTQGHNGEKLAEIVRMSRELNLEKQRRVTLEERLNTRYEELKDKLENTKKENEQIETTLNNL